MRLNLRLIVELLSLFCIVLAVYLGTHLVWATLLAWASAGLYLAYIWEFEEWTLSKPKWVKRGKKPARK